MELSKEQTLAKLKENLYRNPTLYVGDDNELRLVMGFLAFVKSGLLYPMNLSRKNEITKIRKLYPEDYYGTCIARLMKTISETRYYMVQAHILNFLNSELIKVLHTVYENKYNRTTRDIAEQIFHQYKDKYNLQKFEQVLEEITKSVYALRFGDLLNFRVPAENPYSSPLYQAYHTHEHSYYLLHGAQIRPDKSEMS